MNIEIIPLSSFGDCLSHIDFSEIPTYVELVRYMREYIYKFDELPSTEVDQHGVIFTIRGYRIRIHHVAKSSSYEIRYIGTEIYLNGPLYKLFMEGIFIDSES